MMCRDFLLRQWPAALLVAIAAICGGRWVSSEEKPAAATSPDVTVTEIDKEFRDFVQPLFKQYCIRCHNADQMKSGIRVDLLTGIPEDKHLFLWKDILKQISDGAMPPEDEPQFDENQKKRLTGWIQRAMNSAMARNTQRNGTIRRLTVSQYRNTLRDLLGLEEDLTEVLPPDAISKDGFANNGQSMVLSPLQVESYFDIAQKSLDLCIVDENKPPTIQTFRMDLGQGINPTPCPDKLILGANNHLLNNADFQVTEPQPSKPFPFTPVRSTNSLKVTRATTRCADGESTTASITRFSRACEGTPVIPREKPFKWSRQACCFVRRFQVRKSSVSRVPMDRWQISRFHYVNFLTPAISE